MEDVVEATHLINPFIDKLDPIEGEYLLEVSSPGAEKELRNIEAVKKLSIVMFIWKHMNKIRRQVS
jgi:ribosome maturation factor RimP